MENFSKIIISNYWHNPGIKISLFHGDDAPEGGIKLEIPLEDFIQAIMGEITHPVRGWTWPWTKEPWTRAQQENQLRSAIDNVVDKIKQASAQAL